MNDKLIKNEVLNLSDKDIHLNKLISNTSIDNVIFEVNDFLLSKDEIYENADFMNLFIEQLFQLKECRIINFIKNIITNNPNKNRTYSHIYNDIRKNLVKSYNIDESWMYKNRDELDNICDNLLYEGRLFELLNLRKFIDRKFRVNRYNNFILEFNSMALKILKDNGLDRTDKDYIRLRAMLKDNMGYIGPFLWLMKNENVRIGALNELFRILKENPYIKKYMIYKDLSYYIKIKLPYKSPDGRIYNSIREIISDDLYQALDTHNAKLMADEYPGKLKNIYKNKYFINICKILNEDNDDSKIMKETYKYFFLNKISKYKSEEDLINALEKFIESLIDSKDVVDKLKNLSDLRIIYQTNEIIIFRVLSFETMGYIGSDSSWCISQNLQYWIDYVGSGNSGNYQIVIYDLTKKETSIHRKIAFTLSTTYSGKYTYRTGHLKNDNYISEKDLVKLLSNYDIKMEDIFKEAVKFGYNMTYDDYEINQSGYGNF